MTSFRVSGYNLTAETMQTNMSPLTWITSLLNRSRTALLYSKNELFLRTQYPCVKRFFRSNDVKQDRLEKQMFRAVGCIVELSRLKSDGHRHDLWLTRPAVSFGGGTTRESGGNRAYILNYIINFSSQFGTCNTASGELKYSCQAFM